MNNENLNGKVQMFVLEGVVGRSVLQAVIADWRLIAPECALWDFKLELPILEAGAQSEEYKFAMAELAKDAVAFFNSYGGYILVGIADSGSNRFVGVSDEFDISDLNNKIEGFTGKSIDCTYRIIDLEVNGETKPLGVLHIPKRSADDDPVSFSKAAPSDARGNKAFRKNDTYMRVRDTCVPATDKADNWQLLLGPRDQYATTGPVEVQKHPLNSNLGPKDPEMFQFVGRDADLAKLRSWFFSPRDPIRMIAGIGGVGKTSLAYEFATEILDATPNSIEHLIWLSAKKQTYSPIRGELVKAARVDFEDLNSLFFEILSEIGSEPDWLGDEPDIDELADSVIEALEIYPSFIIIDDIDTLEPELQRDLTFRLQQILYGASQRTDGSKVLLTSRLDHGLAPGQVMEVLGLPVVEFAQLVQSVASGVGVDLNLKPNSSQMREFHTAASGSPLFASSIIRLVQLGTPLGQAIKRWKATEGAEVREFTFKRELDRLTQRQARTLYAISLLGVSSAIELERALEMAPRQVSDDVSSLSAYHLLTNESSRDGILEIRVPEVVRSMKDLIKEQISRPSEIEKSCARIRNVSAGSTAEVGATVAKVIELWRNDKIEESIIIAKEATEGHPKNGDLYCLLGRALVIAKPPRAGEAEKAFLTAYELGCRKEELFEQWIEAKSLIEDWPGLLDVSEGIKRHRNLAKIRAMRAKAFREIVGVRMNQKRYGEVPEISLRAVVEITDVLKNWRPEWEFKDDLHRSRLWLAGQHQLALLKTSGSRANDHIHVFEGLAKVVENRALPFGEIERGIEYILTWWQAVKEREVVDEEAYSILENNRNRLEYLNRTLKNLAQPPEDLLKRIAEIDAYLEEQLAAAPG